MVKHRSRLFGRRKQAVLTPLPPSETQQQQQQQQQNSHEASESNNKALQELFSSIIVVDENSKKMSHTNNSEADTKHLVKQSPLSNTAATHNNNNTNEEFLLVNPDDDDDRDVILGPQQLMVVGDDDDDDNNNNDDGSTTPLVETSIPLLQEKNKVILSTGRTEQVVAPTTSHDHNNKNHNNSSRHDHTAPHEQEEVVRNNMPSFVSSSSSSSLQPSHSYYSGEYKNNNCLQCIVNCEAPDCILLSPFSKCDPISIRMDSSSSNPHLSPVNSSSGSSSSSSSSMSTTTSTNLGGGGGGGLNQNSILSLTMTTNTTTKTTTTALDMPGKEPSNCSHESFTSQQEQEEEIPENGNHHEIGTIEVVRVSTQHHDAAVTYPKTYEQQQVRSMEYHKRGDTKEANSQQPPIIVDNDNDSSNNSSGSVQIIFHEPKEIPSKQPKQDYKKSESSTTTTPAVSSSQNAMEKHCLVQDGDKHDDDDVEIIYVSNSPTIVTAAAAATMENEHETVKHAAATGTTVVAAFALHNSKTLSSKTNNNNNSSSNSTDDTTNLPKRASCRSSSTIIPSAIDPFAPREGKTLWWEGVNMVVKDRIILNHVWGSVPHQRTTAIMGPSGAGKTSLLNILAGRMRISSSSATATSRSIQVQATVRLDNYNVNFHNNHMTAMRQMIAFVAQDDSLPPTETPREAIRFSAKLRLGRDMTNEQLDDLTEYMLNELGLMNCADTIVGGPLLKGISGGERKRTSVGVELVVKPAMVFLDEPTSGLDAFSAVQVCQLLKKVAHAGASVLFTIHQPSSKIFREFDHLILLNKGRVMYQGPVEDVGEYFGARGHACPMNYNPADWIMKVAQKIPVEMLEEDGFFPHDEADMTEPTTSGSEMLQASKVKDLEDNTLSLWTQVSVLMKREMKHIRRDRKATIIRIFQSILMSSLIGIIFFNVGQASRTSPSNLQSQFGAIVLMSCITMTAPAQTALMAFPTERPIFLREYATRHYTVVAYFLSRLAMEALICAVQCIIMLTVAYNLIQFRGSFLTFLGSCYALGMASTAIAVVLGAAAGSNTKIAVCLLPLVLMPQFLFIGYFIVPEMIPAWLRWLRWLCPMAYATRILLVDEFSDCTNNPFEKFGCELLLNSVEAQAENVWWYWLLLAAQFVLFRLSALAILKHSVKTFY